MPDIARFYIRHVLIGFAMSAVFVGLLFYFNVANLWHLVSTSDVGLLAAFLLVMFNGIVFSGVQFGIAIMRLAEPEPPKSGGNAPEPLAVPVPVRTTDR